MLRRQLLSAALAAPAIVAASRTEAAPGWRKPVVDLTEGGKIHWMTEAREHPLAGAVHAELAMILGWGYAPCSGGWPLDWLVDLKDPMFVVNMKPIWNTWSGYDPSELAPAALLIESGIEIGEYRSFRYTSSDGSPKPDWARASGLRKAHIEDDKHKALDKKLPGQLRLDMRWLEAVKPETA